MITIKNISTATIVVSANDMHFRRKIAPKRVINVPDDVYDELSFDVGFQNLVSYGFLKIDGVNADTAAVIEVEKTVAEAEDIKEILEKRDITKFAKIIKDASNATKESIVNLAVEMRVVDASFAALIKTYCGVDIIEAVSAQAEA